MDTLEDSRDVKTYLLGVLCAQFLRRNNECFTYCPHYHFIAALTHHITISQRKLTWYIVINYRTSSSLYSTKDTGVVIQTISTIYFAIQFPVSHREPRVL